ncbi:MAG: acetyl xylan esterase, partial [Isosphaeraceae bacterium]|nr:acetyl xylan esterase [Isosphaeraceae bacterium]
LIAPRPLKLVGATGDWTAKTMTNAYPAIQGVYRLVGRPDDVSADVFPFKHNYNQTSRNAVYAFMAPWLLGIEDAESTREGEQTAESPEDLHVFDDDHPPPPGLKTAEQLETELVGLSARQRDKLAPGHDTAAWEASRDLLATNHRVRIGLENPAPAQIESREVRRGEREGFTIIHDTVGRKDRGEQIPVVRLIPRAPTGQSTVIFHPRGKAGLVAATGQPAPLARALLALGHTVIGFDPLLIGESVDPSAPATRRPSTRHFETYNPSLASDRAQDLATVLAWARSRPGTRRVHLVGQGMAGPLALLARPALEGLARTAIDLHEFSYKNGSAAIPEGLDLPGVLQFGGLEGAAALACPAPLWIYRAGPDFQAPWPRRAYALADASGVLRLDEESIRPEVLARWLDTGEVVQQEGVEQ